MDSSFNRTILKCKYCQAMLKTNWEPGKTPVCPNCGGAMEVPSVKSTETVHSWKDNRKAIAIIGILVTLTVIIVIVAVIMNRSSNSSSNPSSNSSSNQQGEIYAEAIGRTLYWDSVNEGYYDDVTQCYCWYNDEVSPAVWQYWYKGISDNYPGYGWMEYVHEENIWVIEINQNDWISLPDIYDDYELWHMD